MLLVNIWVIIQSKTDGRIFYYFTESDMSGLVNTRTK